MCLNILMNECAFVGCHKSTKYCQKNYKWEEIIQYYNCPYINTTVILKMTMLVTKYGYMFRLFLSHPQANMVTEFRHIKCAFYVPKFCDHIGLRMA